MFFQKYYSTPTGFIAFVSTIKTNSNRKWNHFEHQEEETWSQRDAERNTERGWGNGTSIIWWKNKQDKTNHL